MAREIRNEKVREQNPLTGFPRAPEAPGDAKGGPQAVGPGIARVIIRRDVRRRNGKNPGERTRNAE